MVNSRTRHRAVDSETTVGCGTRAIDGGSTADAASRYRRRGRPSDAASRYRRRGNRRTRCRAIDRGSTADAALAVDPGRITALPTRGQRGGAVQDGSRTMAAIADSPYDPLVLFEYDHKPVWFC
jgi:hypothetical protein